MGARWDNEVPTPPTAVRFGCSVWRSARWRADPTDSPITAVAWNPAGTEVAAADLSGIVTRYAMKAPRAPIDTGAGHRSSVAWDGGGTAIAASSFFATVKVHRPFFAECHS